MRMALIHTAAALSIPVFMIAHIYLLTIGYAFKKHMMLMIDGFDEGLSYIGEGGSISLYIPSKLGYGNKETSSIPANSVLFFDVELINIK